MKRLSFETDIIDKYFQKEMAKILFGLGGDVNLK